LNGWAAVYRSAWVVLFILFTIGLVCIFLPKCHHLRQLQERKAELQAENRETEAMTRALQASQNRFSTDPAYVERIARETGMVKPDEVVFQYTNAPAHSPASTRRSP
jgi:cell division protein FtsB